MPSVFQSPITEAIDAALDANVEEPRGHLGMSAIGGDRRTLWLNFHWSLPDEIAPRTRRIFALGHILEDEVIRLLRLAGYEVINDDGGAQFRFSYFGDHFAGSIDGVIRGLPQAPNKWHILEVKSVKGERFTQLQKDGVEKWDAVYYAQMQSYMGAAELDRALFAAYNKNTSELYFERVKQDRTFWPAMRLKAIDILENTIPGSDYPDRSWYEIKNYKSEHYQRVYWGDELPPKVHCRNCRFAQIDTENPGARWLCGKNGKALSIEDQLAGCDQHNFIPDLMPARRIDESSESVTYRAPNDQEFTNGPEKFSSKELVEISKVRFDPEFLSGDVMQEAKRLFPNVTVDKINVVDSSKFWPSKPKGEQKWAS